MNAPAQVSAQDITRALHHIAVARGVCCKRWPYYTSILLRLQPHPMPGLGTVAVTDRAVLMFDPLVVVKWSQPEMQGALIHEINHLLRKHSKRCGKRDHKRFNISSDLEINDDLRAAGAKLPGFAVYPDTTFNLPLGQPAEWYYDKLPSPPAPKEPACAGGWCGSGGGRAVPNEPVPPGDGTGPDEKGSPGPPGVSEAELDAIRQAVAQAVQARAEAGGKNQGSVPAGLLRWATGVLAPPKVRWEDKLARCIRRAVAWRPGASDYRHDAPARRQAAIGYGSRVPILARTVRPIPNVQVAIDTSGSMGVAELGAALRELRAVLTAVGGPIRVVSCDAAVHSAVKALRWEDAAKALQGGGGTSFVPVFDDIARLHPADRPDLLVFATDLYGTFPVHPPRGLQVVWLAVGNKTGKAPFGETVNVD